MNDYRVARGLWSLYEPIHAVTYFTPQARAALEEAGLRGFWRGYFAGRAAPLGAVDEPVVTAVFSGFVPRMVARALPSVWQLASPSTALRARATGAAAAIRSVVSDADAAAVLDVLGRAVDGLPVAGRPLGAANASVPEPDDPIERLWQATTTLREWRGDAHTAALVTHGVAGLDILVLRCALDVDRGALQPARGWPDEEWAASADGLRGRGLLAGDQVTPEGRALIRSVEQATDEASTLEDPRALARALRPIATACAALLPFPNPIGLGQLWDPELDPGAEQVPPAGG